METTLKPAACRQSGGPAAVLPDLKTRDRGTRRVGSAFGPHLLPLLVVFCWAAFLFLFLSGSAQAQSTSRFGSAGPTSGQIGFGTATTGASFGVGSSAPSLSTSLFPGGQVAGEGRRTGGLGAALGTPGGMTQPHEAPVPPFGQQNSRFPGMAQAAVNQPGPNPNPMTNSNPQNRLPQSGGAQNGQIGTSINGTNNVVYANPTNNAVNANRTNAARRQAQQRPMPVQVIVAHPPIRGSAGRLATRFERLSGRPGLEDVRVQSRGGKVILRGHVNSLEARRLASILARMQPGVDSVVNELEITSPYD